MPCVQTVFCGEAKDDLKAIYDQMFETQQHPASWSFLTLTLITKLVIARTNFAHRPIDFSKNAWVLFIRLS